MPSSSTKLWFVTSLSSYIAKSYRILAVQEPPQNANKVHFNTRSRSLRDCDDFWTAIATNNMTF
jgi:hypothetical protein